MWCHLCTQDYPDFEDFRIHIMEKHRNASNFCKENSDSESVHENAEISDIDDEDAALNTFKGNCYESDHNIDTEIKSDTSEDGNDNTAALNTFSGQYRNLGAEIKSDDSMDVDDNTVSGKYNNSDDTVATENKSNLSKTPLNNLPGKSDDDEAETSIVKNTVLKKRKQRCNKENKSAIKATAANKQPKKLKVPSILKKRGRKKQLKVSFSKKASPKRKLSAVSYQEDIPEDSDGHSESSLNDDDKVNPPSVLNNFMNPSIPVNNYTQPISNNNPVYIVNPYGGQGMNNFVLGNQAVQPPVYIVNPVSAKPTPPKTHKCFDFHSQNILKWLTKHKELCKNMEYPLPSSLFDQVKAVHKGIFDHYCTASISEETTAVLKVYEELDCMIHKHINSINNALSIS